MIASCGHTFCRRCVEEGVHRICPKDKKSLAVVVENIAVNEQVWKIESFKFPLVIIRAWRNIHTVRLIDLYHVRLEICRCIVVMVSNERRMAGRKVRIHYFYD